MTLYHKETRRRVQPTLLLYIGLAAARGPSISASNPSLFLSQRGSGPTACFRPNKVQMPRNLFPRRNRHLWERLITAIIVLSNLFCHRPTPSLPSRYTPPALYFTIRPVNPSCNHTAAFPIFLRRTNNARLRNSQAGVMPQSARWFSKQCVQRVHYVRARLAQYPFRLQCQPRQRGECDWPFFHYRFSVTLRAPPHKT